MDIATLLDDFRHLHNEARAGVLATSQLSEYRSARDQLTRLLLAAQHIALLPGQQPRLALRVARSLAVELYFHDRTVRAMTTQVSSGGFAALAGNAPQQGEEVRIRLHLPGGQPLETTARVVSSSQQIGQRTTSFQFAKLNETEAERIEIFVFDAILQHFQGI